MEKYFILSKWSHEAWLPKRVYLATPVIGNFIEIQRKQNVALSYNNAGFQEYSSMCRML
jgi:hypothetical protein